MKTYLMARIGIALALIASAGGLSPALGDSYPSLDGVDRLELAYDVRLSDPQKAALFLKLIHRTYNDKELRSLPRPPAFVVVFSGEAVALIADDYARFPREDRPYLEEIAGHIEALAAEGVRIEGCLGAAEIFGVDSKLFYDEIQKINNAWISISGYQAQGFSMIPVY